MKKLEETHVTYFTINDETYTLAKFVMSDYPGFKKIPFSSVEDHVCFTEALFYRTRKGTIKVRENAGWMSKKDFRYLMKRLRKEESTITHLK